MNGLTKAQHALFSGTGREDGGHQATGNGGLATACASSAYAA